MEPEAGVPSALCIAGMHRSGTSLVSSLLQSGGLDIGHRLVGAGPGNVKGHFEDLDFNELHLQILESQGIRLTGFTLQRDLQIREQHVLAARALVEQRRRRRVDWGWKDPRNTLFLDFWRQMVPEAHFLLLYRCPWDVVDSLFRRGDWEFRSDPSFAVRVWCHYNRLLLDFHDRFPERCLCADNYRVIQSPTLLLEALAAKFGLKLGTVAELYDASLLHRLDSSRWASLLQHDFPEALELYEQLNQRASQMLVNGVSLAAEATSFLPGQKDWTVQDWLDLRVLEVQNQELRTQLEKSQAELTRVWNELQAQLATLHGQLGQMWREKEQSQADLRHAQAQLRAVEDLVANMESSKFWKLRQAWMAAKHCLRRAG